MSNKLPPMRVYCENCRTTMPAATRHLVASDRDMGGVSFLCSNCGSRDNFVAACEVSCCGCPSTTDVATTAGIRHFCDNHAEVWRLTS